MNKNLGSDKINHPKHYHPGKFETINVIEAWNLDYNLANAIKYISRANLKGDLIEDLKKSIWYLRRRIKLEQKKSKKLP